MAISQCANPMFDDSRNCNQSSQIMIFHQPRFPWNNVISLPTPLPKLGEKHRLCGLSRANLTKSMLYYNLSQDQLARSFASSNSALEESQKNSPETILLRFNWFRSTNWFYIKATWEFQTSHLNQKNWVFQAGRGFHCCSKIIIAITHVGDYFFSQWTILHVVFLYKMIQFAEKKKKLNWCKTGSIFSSPNLLLVDPNPVAWA